MKTIDDYVSKTLKYGTSTKVLKQIIDDLNPCRILDFPNINCVISRQQLPVGLISTVAFFANTDYIDNEYTLNYFINKNTHDFYRYVYVLSLNDRISEIGQAYCTDFYSIIDAFGVKPNSMAVDADTTPTIPMSYANDNIWNKDYHLLFTDIEIPQDCFNRADMRLRVRVPNVSMHTLNLNNPFDIEELKRSVIEVSDMDTSDTDEKSDTLDEDKKFCTLKPPMGCKFSPAWIMAEGKTTTQVVPAFVFVDGIYTDIDIDAGKVDDVLKCLKTINIMDEFGLTIVTANVLSFNPIRPHDSDHPLYQCNMHIVEQPNKCDIVIICKKADVEKLPVRISLIDIIVNDDIMYFDPTYKLDVIDIFARKSLDDLFAEIIWPKFIEEQFKKDTGELRLPDCVKKAKTARDIFFKCKLYETETNRYYLCYCNFPPYIVQRFFELDNMYRYTEMYLSSQVNIIEDDKYEFVKNIQTHRASALKMIKPKMTMSETGFTIDSILLMSGPYFLSSLEDISFAVFPCLKPLKDSIKFHLFCENFIYNTISGEDLKNILSTTFPDEEK